MINKKSLRNENEKFISSVFLLCGLNLNSEGITQASRVWLKILAFRNAYAEGNN